MLFVGPGYINWANAVIIVFILNISYIMFWSDTFNVNHMQGLLKLNFYVKVAFLKLTVTWNFFRVCGIIFSHINSFKYICIIMFCLQSILWETCTILPEFCQVLQYWSSARTYLLFGAASWLVISSCGFTREPDRMFREQGDSRYCGQCMQG